jgi:hypothetical protein
MSPMSFGLDLSHSYSIESQPSPVDSWPLRFLLMTPWKVVKVRTERIVN